MVGLCTATAVSLMGLHCCRNTSTSLTTRRAPRPCCTSLPAGNRGRRHRSSACPTAARIRRPAPSPDPAPVCTCCTCAPPKKERMNLCWSQFPCVTNIKEVEKGFFNLLANMHMRINHCRLEPKSRTCMCWRGRRVINYAARSFDLPGISRAVKTPKSSRIPRISPLYSLRLQIPYSWQYRKLSKRDSFPPS